MNLIFDIIEKMKKEGYSDKAIEIVKNSRLALLLS